MSETDRAAAGEVEAGAQLAGDEPVGNEPVGNERVGNELAGSARGARAAAAPWCWARVGGWTMLGAVGCLGVGALARPGAVAGGAGGAASEVAGWVLDRDGGALIALDEDRLKLARHPLESPVELALDAEGRLWVACAGPQGPVGPHRVLRIDGASGAVDRELSTGPVLDLEAGEGAERGRGEAWLVVIAGSAEREVSRISAAGSAEVVERSIDAFCVAGQRGAVLVGSESGELRLYGPQGQRLAARNFGGLISDLAPGPQDGTWWILDAHGSSTAHRVALLERDLRTRWERSAGIAAIYLAPVPRSERVWLSDANGSHARRFGPGGTLELAHVTLPHSGAARACASPDGTLWLAAPGALVCLDAAGAVTPGQGGFDFLVDVVRREVR